MHDDHDNSIDDDDTLDYLIYKKCEERVCKRQEDTRGKGGCLGLLQDAIHRNQCHADPFLC